MHLSDLFSFAEPLLSGGFELIRCLSGPYVSGKIIKNQFLPETL
jgi:hypothetical protein